MVAADIGESVRVLKGIDGAELRVGACRTETIIAGETQVWNSRIAVDNFVPRSEDLPLR
jgi:hypothetical protein